MNKEIKSFVVVLGVVILMAMAGGASMGLKSITGADDNKASGAKSETARVVFVYDGDTVEVEFASGQRERVRIVGVDTPEIDECYYEEASIYARESLLNKEVSLMQDSQQPSYDKYNRLLRYIEVGGKDFGEGLVREGYAIALDFFDYDKKSYYNELEKTAKAGVLGRFSSCN